MMNELDKKIFEIMGESIDNERAYMGVWNIKEFISKCSLSDFEKLKDMEWDISNEKTEETQNKIGMGWDKIDLSKNRFQ